MITRRQCLQPVVQHMRRGGEGEDEEKEDEDEHLVRVRVRGRVRG